VAFIEKKFLVRSILFYLVEESKVKSKEEISNQERVKEPIFLTKKLHNNKNKKPNMECHTLLSS